MPFTFAHPVAVLWGARWHQSGLPFSAWVIGSMSPDFEYFLRLRTASIYSHTVPGIFAFCLPIGIVIYVLHRWVVSPALYRNLPRSVRERLLSAPPINDPLRHLIFISAAMMTGAATHIIWDAFTHRDGYFVMASGTLELRVLGLPVYKFLQHGSTLLGFGIMALWFFRQPRVPSPATINSDSGYWPTFAVASFIALIALHQIRPEFAPGTLIVQGIVALFAGLLIAGVLFRDQAPITVESSRFD